MRIIEEKCLACGQCEEYCRFDAIKPKKRIHMGYSGFTIDPSLCTNCGGCLKVACPGQAIEN